MLSSSISAKVSKMSFQGYKGYNGSASQHSHPHNNTVSRNNKFCVDQVTPLPPTPPGKDKGWGRARGGGAGNWRTANTTDKCKDQMSSVKSVEG